MDETSLKLHVHQQPGLVVEPCPKRRRQLLREGQGPNLQTRRAAATLIAFVCDDAALQPLLPQVLVCSERLMNVADFDKLRGHCDGIVRLVRRRSSWVDAAFVAEVIQLLADCLESELPKYHTVLHMDTCPPHMHRSVLDTCAAAGIYVHFVPALTTGWLQPLDVVIFSAFKAWVSREFEQQQLASMSGDISRLDVLGIYVRAVREVLQHRRWGHAFDLCGLSGQAGLSKRLLALLGYEAPPAVGSELPSLSDLVAIFPKGTNIPIESLFQTAVPKLPRPGVTLRLPAVARLPRAPRAQ